MSFDTIYHNGISESVTKPSAVTSQFDVFLVYLCQQITKYNEILSEPDISPEEKELIQAEIDSIITRAQAELRLIKSTLIVQKYDLIDSMKFQQNTNNEISKLKKECENAFNKLDYARNESRERVLLHTLSSLLQSPLTNAKVQQQINARLSEMVTLLQRYVQQQRLSALRHRQLTTLFQSSQKSIETIMHPHALENFLQHQRQQQQIDDSSSDNNNSVSSIYDDSNDDLNGENEIMQEDNVSTTNEEFLTILSKFNEDDLYSVLKTILEIELVNERKNNYFKLIRLNKILSKRTANFLRYKK